MREHYQVCSIGVVGLLAGLLLSCAATGAERSAPQPKGDTKRSSLDGEARALAATIDRILAAKWTEAKVTPAPQADDAEFLRRVALDLTGKIPTAAEARDFLDDPRPDKRKRLVDRLLESPAYLVSATEIWRSMLLPEADTECAGAVPARRRSKHGSGNKWPRTSATIGSSGRS